MIISHLNFSNIKLLFSSPLNKNNFKNKTVYINIYIYIIKIANGKNFVVNKLKNNVQFEF